MFVVGDTGIVTKALVVALYHFRTAPVPVQPVAVKFAELPKHIVVPDATGAVELVIFIITVLLLAEIQVNPLVVFSHLA